MLISGNHAAGLMAERVGLDRLRPVVEVAAARAACRPGLLVGRLGRDRTLDLTAPRADQVEAVAEWSRPQRGARWLTLGLTARGDRLPFVATVSGYVLLGAEITGLAYRPGGVCRLELADAGSWYDGLRDRRWFPGRGGPPLLLWGWPFPDPAPRRHHDV